MVWSRGGMGRVRGGAAAQALLVGARPGQGGRGCAGAVLAGNWGHDCRVKMGGPQAVVCVEKSRALLDGRRSPRPMQAVRSTHAAGEREWKAVGLVPIYRYR